MIESLSRAARNSSTSNARTSTRSGHAIAGFMRDVLVNVAANLIAAALIYIAGTTAGILPTSRQLIMASIGTVLAATAVALFAISRFTGERQRIRIGGLVMTLAGPAIMASTFGGSFDHELLPRWFFYGFGILATFAGCGSLYLLRNLDRMLSLGRNKVSENANPADGAER